MEKNFSRILVGFGVVFFCSFFVLAQRVVEPGPGEWSRAGLLWGCWVMFWVSSSVLPVSLHRLVWLGK